MNGTICGKCTDEKRLEETMRWLCRAQDATMGGGVSGGFSLEKGWTPPYPETTGYIIPTFFNYAKITGDETYRTRAIAMGDWELEIQLPSGGVRGGIGLKDAPIVFDTGQVILGWTSLFAETGESKYRDAATRAADWLAKIQDPDGKWSKHEFLGHLHAYNSRVAWSLAKAHALTSDEKYLDAARRNISWTLSLVGNNGWIEHMSFNPKDNPFTHTIAYTLRGLFETSQYLDESIKAQAISAVEGASSQIIGIHRLDRTDGCRVFLPGQLNRNWKSWSRYSCMTGNAQFAILFLKLYDIFKDEKYRMSALNLIDSVGDTQNLVSEEDGIRGAIPGSHPLGGKYQSNTYPNWAAKFFADALMLKNESR